MTGNMNEEIEALIKFIEAREPGNVLRDIAKQRIEFLEVGYNKVYQRDWLSSPIRLRDKMTGGRFNGIREAARIKKICHVSLWQDIIDRTFKYGIEPV